MRKLKALGLAAITALAMSAVEASAAQAGEFTANQYPAAIVAISGNDVFTTVGSETNCEESSFEATLTQATKTIKVHPKYSKCKFGPFPATVDFTTCAYVFHADETEEGGAITVDASIECEDELDRIDITVFASHAAHTAGTPICHVWIPEQARGDLVSHLTAENLAGGYIRLTGSITSITATQDRTSAFCPSDTHTDHATYRLNNSGVIFQGLGDNGIDVG